MTILEEGGSENAFEEESESSLTFRGQLGEGQFTAWVRRVLHHPDHGLQHFGYRCPRLRSSPPQRDPVAA